MKYLSIVVLALLSALTKSCDYEKILLMISPYQGTETEGNGYTLEVADTGNFVIRNSEDDVIYDNECYCEGSECPGEFEIKIQKDGNIFIIPEDGHNDFKVWKNNKPGDHGIYALVIADEEPQVWKFNGTSTCPMYTTKMWSPSDGGICYGSDTPPSVCDFTKDLLVLSTDSKGKEFVGSDYTLEVREKGNIVISQNNGGSITYDNECYNSNTDYCYTDFEIELEADGNAFVIPEGENGDDHKVWESNERGIPGTYALVVNNNAVQILKFEGTRDCPWYAEDYLWSEQGNDGCYGSDHELNCDPPCDFSKDLLMLSTDSKGKEFVGSDYTLEVREKGNIIISQKNGGSITYDNECYNSNTDYCSTDFEIELEADGNAFVIPEGENGDDHKVWESNERGIPGTYALVVNNNAVQILKFEGTRDCPWYAEDYLWSEQGNDGCYGSDHELNCDPPCDFSKDLLMISGEQDDYMEGNYYNLVVSMNGEVVVRRNSDDFIIYENDCYNDNTDFCNRDFEIRLEANGNALVIPEDEDGDAGKVWQSSWTGSQGTYALVVNNNELQIWTFEGDWDCPLYTEKMWDEDDGDFCHGGHRPLACAQPECDFSKDLLMITPDKGKEFYGEDYTLEVQDDANFLVIKNDDDTIIYDNYCYRSVDFCYTDFEIKLQTDGNAFVIPEGGNNDDKSWKSNNQGSQGTYAFVVDNNEAQIYKFEGTRDCPKYGDKLWSQYDHSDLCYQSENKITCGASAVCDTKKAILMVTRDQGKNFHSHIKSSYLEVKDTGELVLEWSGNIMFQNNCKPDCRGQRRQLFNRRDRHLDNNQCFSSYEVKLQDDGHLIVVPEGKNNNEKVWATKKTGPVGPHYALVDNYKLNTGECLQIWSWNGDFECPVFYDKIWDCSDCAWCKGDTLCYES